MTNSKTADIVTGSSRREFLKSTSLAVGSLAVGTVSAAGDAAAVAPPDTGGLPITLSGYRYARTEALIDGRINVKNCNIRFEADSIGYLNTHILSGPQTREVSEIGLHPFMLAWANEGFRDYSLLPVFPLRVFRHKSVFIRSDRGIEKPEDLRGRKIATPGYSSTSLTWIRGIFQDEYGIRPQDIEWVTSSKDSAAKTTGTVSKQEQALPEGVNITPGPAGKDESDLLESGAVDALFHAMEPRAYIEGDPRIARLFSDYRSTERQYFTRTGIFPIMHAVAIKNAALKRHPWLAEAIFNAYCEAKGVSYQHMARLGWAYDSLPWYVQELEETRALMGNNFYSYGIGPNRKTLETLFRYSHQQGLCSRRLTIEELFAPGSLMFSDSSA